EDAVKVGDVVRVRVLEVDPQSRRISLTVLLEDRPREEASSDAASEPRREERSQRTLRSFDRPPREERSSRRSRQESAPAPAPEVYSVSDEPEEFKGDATLEDLLSKFSGSGGKRERRRRNDDDEGGDEETNERYSRRQRD